MGCDCAAAKDRRRGIFRKAHGLLLLLESVGVGGSDDSVGGAAEGLGAGVARAFRSSVCVEQSRNGAGGH